MISFGESPLDINLYDQAISTCSARVLGGPNWWSWLRKQGGCFHLISHVCPFPHSTSSLHSFIWFFLKCFSNAIRGQSIMMGNVDKSMILVLIEFTCCVGDETCYTSFFGWKAFGGKCSDNGPDSMSSWEEIKQRSSPAGEGREHHGSWPGRESIWADLQKRQRVDTWEATSASWSTRDVFLKGSESPRTGDSVVVKGTGREDREVSGKWRLHRGVGWGQHGWASPCGLSKALRSRWLSFYSMGSCWKCRGSGVPCVDFR